MISFSHNEQQAATMSSPLKPLIDVLRDELGDTSPKPGCRQGRCGACTVLIDGKAVLSCLVPLGRANGTAITTAKGLADGEVLTAVQRAFARAGALQCGICTPGMVMAVTALLNETPNPDRDQIRAGLVGNLCRCTGYVQIIEAVIDLVTRAGVDHG